MSYDSWKTKSDLDDAPQLSPEVSDEDVAEREAFEDHEENMRSLMETESEDRTDFERELDEVNFEFALNTFLQRATMPQLIATRDRMNAEIQAQVALARGRKERTDKGGSHNKPKKGKVTG